MIKIQNDSRYDSDNYIINPDNIAYIEESHVDYDGYIHKDTHILIVHFIGQSKLELELKTYDKEKFNKWLELFEVKEKLTNE